MFGYSKEAVRVKVKKCEGKLQPELRKFSVDPQITSLEVLQSILIKAFDIKADFTLYFKTFDDNRQEILLPILSDWDLDAAFLRAQNIAALYKCEPCVQLQIDMKPFAEDAEDWEPPSIVPGPVIPLLSTKDKPPSAPVQQAEKQEFPTGFQGMIFNQMEKTFNMVSKALNLYDDPNSAPRPPLSDSEFRSFLNGVGQITDSTKLREVIYCGGIDHSLRKVVWKHILNIYPDGMTGKQRMDYIKRKANEYYTLREKWKDCIQKGKVNADLAYVTSMVRKDVLRTDRHHTFYAGSDDNQNIASLFNMLTTYALYHPSVSYCQGMSDLASPLLVTMGDEAHAYICLCALMSRLYPNFLLDGEAMTLKFAHLTESLQVYDPDFYVYLKSQQADDLLFCYRWLLLEMKREFAFDDALRMLEVLWASLPQKPQLEKELSLKEKEFDPDSGNGGETPPISPLVKAPRENAYTKLCAIRRQSSSFSLANKNGKLTKCRQIHYSLDENSIRKYNDSSLKRAKEYQSLDDSALQRLPSQKDRKLGKSLSRSENSRNISKDLAATAIVNTNSDKKEPNALSSQIRLLRDKISMHNNKFNSIDSDNSTETSEKTKCNVKMIKNLNEFLNLATTSKPDDESDLNSQAPIRDIRLSHTIHRSFNQDSNDGSSPDESQEYCPMTTSMTRELRLNLEHLDRQVFGPSFLEKQNNICDSPSTDNEDCPSNASKHNSLTEEIQNNLTETRELESTVTFCDGTIQQTKNTQNVFVWENPLLVNTPHKPSGSGLHTPDEQAELEYDGDTGEIIEEYSGKKSITPIRLLRKQTSSEQKMADGDKIHSSESDSSEIETLNPFIVKNKQKHSNKSNKFFSSMSQELENAKKSCESILNAKPSNLHSVASTINNFQKKYESLKPLTQKGINVATSSENSLKTSVSGLPPPTLFGGGNPFLMFLCLTVLMQHRDYIMRNRMDYNELAMHFDKMVRKHNVNRVLNQARQMYAIYLKQQAHKTGDIAT